MAVITRSRRAGLDSDWFLKNAQPSTVLSDLQKKIAREEYVRGCKEIYSKKECLSMGISPKEYRTIKGESLYHLGQRNSADAARMMHLVVGAERLN